MYLKEKKARLTQTGLKANEQEKEVILVGFEDQMRRRMSGLVRIQNDCIVDLPQVDRRRQVERAIGLE